MCGDTTIGFYDIMKHFCSDFDKIEKNICDTHKPKFVQLGREFMNK